MSSLGVESLTINPKETAERLALLIRRYMEEAGAAGAAVGMSGGVDSSVTASLACRALGNNRVVGVFMPEAGGLRAEDREDAEGLARTLGVAFYAVDFTEVLGSYAKAIPLYDHADKISAGNLKARIRMSILYYFANRLNYLVVGTGNRSEILTGYFTKYGDGGVDLLPLSGLYKTQVYQLARYLGVPERILAKKPTAGLWPGQLDEEELGISYTTLDLILYGLERGMATRRVAEALRLPPETVESVRRMRLRSEHKRRGPIGLG